MSKVHYVWVNNGDWLVLVSNPAPSATDPVGIIQTTTSAFHILDEGPSGVQAVEARNSVTAFTGKATTEAELKQLKPYGQSARHIGGANVG
jgi:hypothetical protein